MAKVYSIDGIIPVIAPSAFVHPDAVLIGDVIVGPGCYVGPTAVLRGDFGRLILESGCNLQDGCVMHGDADYDTVVGADARVGHGAVLHGCRMERNAMVGMNAVVLDGAVVGEDAVVAAMALVKAHFVVPARTLAAGVPAKIIRDLSADDVARARLGNTAYHELTRRCLATLREVEPLSSVEPDRARVPGSGTPPPLVRGR